MYALNCMVSHQPLPGMYGGRGMALSSCPQVESDGQATAESTVAAIDIWSQSTFPRDKSSGSVGEL